MIETAPVTEQLASMPHTRRLGGWQRRLAKQERLLESLLDFLEGRGDGLGLPEALYLRATNIKLKLAMGLIAPLSPEDEQWRQYAKNRLVEPTYNPISR